MLACASQSDLSGGGHLATTVIRFYAEARIRRDDHRTCEPGDAQRFRLVFVEQE